jgi:hypothetical protein
MFLLLVTAIAVVIVLEDRSSPKWQHIVFDTQNAGTNPARQTSRRDWIMVMNPD